MNFKKIVIFLLSSSIVSNDFHKEEWDFLTGNFLPQTRKDFVEISRLGIPTKGKKLYLQKEVAEALLKMYLQMKKDLPNIDFWVVSATRTFSDQKMIWESKWEKYEKEFSKYQEEKIGRKILQYSSMPGTSRHHWGTDFDINILENSYYEKGNGKVLFDWLKKNAYRFGFCNPYDSMRSEGYLEERWHWSYFPLASKYLIKWNAYYESKKFSISIYKGYHLFKSYAKIYVNSIHHSCK